MIAENTRRSVLERLSEFIYLVEPKYKENVCAVFYEADKLPIDSYDKDQFVVHKLSHFLNNDFKVSKKKRNQLLLKLSSLIIPAERKNAINLRLASLNDLREMFKEINKLIESGDVNSQKFDLNLISLIEKRLEKTNVSEEYAERLKTAYEELRPLLAKQKAI